MWRGSFAALSHSDISGCSGMWGYRVGTAFLQDLPERRIAERRVAVCLHISRIYGWNVHA